MMTTEVVCRLGAQWRTRSRYLMGLWSFPPPPMRFRNRLQQLLCTALDGKKTRFSETPTLGVSQRKKHSNRPRHGGIGLNMASQFEQIQQQIEDLKVIVMKQRQFNQDVLAMLHQAIGGKDGSLIVGSNSPHAIQSKNRVNTTGKHAAKRDQPSLRTYKWHNTKTKSNTKDDPDYFSHANRMSNSDDGSFKFRRGNAKMNPSSKAAPTKSGLRGWRNLFPASMISTGCDKPHSSYVTYMIVKISRARALQ